MDTELIGKFIIQQVAAAMAEKTKQYEEKIKKLEKGGKDRVSGELEIHDSDDYEVKKTQTICVSLGTRPKEHPSEPLK